VRVCVQANVLREEEPDCAHVLRQCVICSGLLAYWLLAAEGDLGSG
jgi:hypothetical protein